MSRYAHLSIPDPEWLSVASLVPPKNNSHDIGIADVREQTSKTRIAAANALGPLTKAEVRIIDKVLTLAEGNIPVRIYVPGGQFPNETEYPVVFWCFGGGFYVGGIDDDDLFLRYICGELNVIVLAVEYRRAPEYPFPTGLNDCYACLKWVASHPQDFYADLSKGLVLAGLSSGGNFATVLSQRASQDPALRDKVTGLAVCIPLLIHLAAYPECFKDELHSVEENKDGPFFTKASFERLLELYNPPDPSHPDMSPLLFPNLKDLYPTYLQVDGMDPCRDEGLLYAKLLRAVEIPTRLDIYPGFPHGFNLIFPHLEAAYKKRDDFKEGLKWLLSRGILK